MAHAYRPVLSYNEWTARVRCNEHEVGGSFSVLLFLGPIPERKEDWRRSPSYVGMHGVYTGGYGGYGGYQQLEIEDEGAREVEGYIKLNEALVKANLPRSLSDKDVVPYLRRHLDWRIQKVRSLFSLSCLLPFDACGLFLLETGDGSGDLTH